VTPYPHTDGTVAPDHYEEDLVCFTEHKDCGTGCGTTAMCDCEADGIIKNNIIYGGAGPDIPKKPDKPRNRQERRAEASKKRKAEKKLKNNLKKCLLNKNMLY